MKRLMKKRVCACLASAMLIFIGTGSSTLAFSSATHVYTTQRGITIVDATLGGEISKFYTEEDRAQIMTYCTRPDEDEIDGAFKYHFYNPATEKNFMGEDDSALERCKNHYNNAVTQYKAGDKKAAFEALGRALHYVEDLNTPVHTNNQDVLDSAFNLPFHVSFEDRCQEIQSTVTTSLLKSEFRYYKLNTIENIAKSCAYLANDNFYALYKEFLPKDVVAANAIKNAQKTVAGLLYKFYLDVVPVNTRMDWFWPFTKLLGK